MYRDLNIWIWSMSCIRGLGTYFDIAATYLHSGREIASSISRISFQHFRISMKFRGLECKCIADFHTKVSCRVFDYHFLFQQQMHTDSI